jgi:hypothetical protein
MIHVPKYFGDVHLKFVLVLIKNVHFTVAINCVCWRFYVFLRCRVSVCWSRWSRGLRLRSAVARLLRFGFESRRGHGCLLVAIVVFCQVEVSATSWSLVQRSPSDYGASWCVIKKPHEWGDHSPRWAAAPKKWHLFRLYATLSNSIIFYWEVLALCLK